MFRWFTTAACLIALCWSVLVGSAGQAVAGTGEPASPLVTAVLCETMAEHHPDDLSPGQPAPSVADAAQDPHELLVWAAPHLPVQGGSTPVRALHPPERPYPFLDQPQRPPRA